MTKTGWIVTGIAGFLFVFLIMPGCVAYQSYNRLVVLNESVDSSWAQVENVMQRRYDLIPNLVNTVKGYAKHEKEVLEEVTRMRSQWGAAQTPGAKLNASQGLEGAISRLLVVAEQYPNLKADENFLRLQDELSGTENRIAVERMRYNDMVKSYNIQMRSFPSNIVAGMFHFTKKDAYFEAVPTAKEAPKVQF